MLVERVIKVLDEHLLDITEMAVDRVVAARLPFYRDAPRAGLIENMKRGLLAVREDLVNGTESAFAGFLVSIGDQRTRQGASVREMLAVVEHGFESYSDVLAQLCADDLPAQVWFERRKQRITMVAVGQLWDTSVAARDEVIRAQTAEIYRLGVTIVPVYRGVVLLPIAGNVDAKRAEQIMSAILDAVVARQSSVVIVDVTGVPSVDTGVISHLLRTAQAVRLLGAEPVLVGINPRVAQGIVDLGVDFQGMTVRGLLEDGVSYALARVGKRITAAANGG